MAAIGYRVTHRLRAHRLATLLLAVAVALAGAMVLVLAGGAARILTAGDRYVAAHDRGDDVVVEQQAGSPRTAEVAALATVRSARGATFVFGGLLPEGVSPEKVGPDDAIEALVFAGDHVALGTELVAGREPRTDRPEEFVASRGFDPDAALGDRYRLVTISGAQAARGGFDAPPDGPSGDARLVGLIDGPSLIEGDQDLVVFPGSMLAWGDVGVAATQMSVDLGAGSSRADLRRELDGLGGESSFAVKPLVLVPEATSAAISAQGQGFAVLAGIVALAAVVVVGQLLSRQCRLRDDEADALRALGQSRAGIVAECAGHMAAPVVVGSAGAVLLAIAASGVFPVGPARLVDPTSGVRFDPWVHLGGAACLGIGLMAWVVVALTVGERPRRRPARRGVADAAAEHLRPAQAATAARFAFTRPSGSPATVLGMVAVFALLIGALVFGSSLGRLTAQSDRWGVTFDLAAGAGGGAIPTEVSDAILADPDVSGLALAGTVAASVDGDAFYASALEAVKGRPPVRLVDGRLPVSVEEIALGGLVADRLGAEVGSTVSIGGADGARRLRVSGIGVLPEIEGAEGVGEGGIVTADALAVLDPEAAALTAAAITLRPGADESAVAARLSQTTGMAVGPPDRPSLIVNLLRVRSIPALVAGSVATLAMLSLGHQLVVSSRRRRHDLAVVRAVGADRSWLGAVVHWQATLVTVAVAVVALPAGIAAGSVVFRAFADRVGVVDDASWPLLTLGLSIVGLVVLANLVAAFNARHVRREMVGRALS